MRARAFEPGATDLTYADVFSHLLHLTEQTKNQRDKSISAVSAKVVGDILRFFTPEVLTWTNRQRNDRKSFLTRLENVQHEFNFLQCWLLSIVYCYCLRKMREIDNKRKKLASNSKKERIDNFKKFLKEQKFPLVPKSYRRRSSPKVRNIF